MEKLNYDVLESLFTGDIGLEITNVDIRRLRDDRTEIQLGQDVAFVAVGSFRLTGEGSIAGRVSGTDLAVGDELFAISADAEVRSDKVAIDEDSVSLWIADHYAFKFMLNGKDCTLFSPVGSVRLNTPSPDGHRERLELPWLRRLNTANIKEDFIDVDVVIDESVPVASPPPPASARWRATDDLPFELEDSQRAIVLDVALEVAPGGGDLDDMIGRKFRLVLASDDPDDDEAEVAVVLTVAELKPEGGARRRGRHDQRVVLAPPVKQGT